MNSCQKLGIISDYGKIIKIISIDYQRFKNYFVKK